MLRVAVRCSLASALERTDPILECRLIVAEVIVKQPPVARVKVAEAS
jgi:hypothetical protein